MIVGLTRGTRPDHLVRAALEANAYQTRDVVEAMNEELDQPIRKLLADGGACANDWLMQFQADILGIPVERSAVLDTTALGAAGLAGLHVGMWDGPADFASQRKVDRVFEPGMDAGHRDDLYARWLRARERSREWAT
jgi:glycerol kinase